MSDSSQLEGSIDHDEHRHSYRMIYEDGLFKDVLPFWLTHGVDHEHGGILTCLDQRGHVIDTDKAVWQQGRFMWLLGELLNNFPNHEPSERQRWIKVAKNCADFLERHCVDSNDDRMWFHLTQEGLPIRKRRYAFSESFAAIAFAELSKALDEPIYAQRSVELFHRFIERSQSQDESSQKYTNTRPTRGLGYPMITLVTAQEMREAIEFDEANDWIDQSIELIKRYHLKPDLRCVMETVGPEGEIIDHFDGRTLNPGHAIEAAWFMMREGMIRSDHDIIGMGTRMLDWMWDRGWDTEYGGMLYFTDLDGHPVQEYWHDMKFWWPHNETIIATLMAYAATGDQKYARRHQLVHRWAYSHFPDREYGEWFGYLDRTGRVTSTAKGNYWKGPFHLPRMQLTCCQLLENMSKSSSD